MQSGCQGRTVSLLVSIRYQIPFLSRNPLTLTCAGADFFWLGIMLWLAMADYVTRVNFPPAIGFQRDAAFQFER